VLAAIFQQQAPFEFEVRIVDSGSSTEELAIMREFPLVLAQIPPREFGHGRTRNLLAKDAAGEVLVFLVQDAQPVGKEWLATLVTALAEPAVGGAFSRQLPWPDASPLMRFFLQETYPPTPARKRTGATEALTFADMFFSNVGSAMRRTVWQQLPFREDVVMSEDQYWAAAALRAGYELVYQPAACLYHSHNYSLLSLFRRNALSGASLRGLIADTPGGVAGRGLDYLRREAAYLLGSGKAGWLPYMMLYEAVRTAGFGWGFRFGRGRIP